MSNYNNMTLKEIEDIAKHFYGSGMFPDIKSASMAVVKIMLGRDLGLSPMEAISGVQVYNGKPTLSATLQALLVRRSGRYDYRIIAQSDEVCEIEWRQGSEVVGVSTYTMSEAKAAGLTGKEVWRKYPSDLLFARALTRGIRRYAADALSGVVYTPEEIEDVQVIERRPDPLRIEQGKAMVHETRLMLESGNVTPPPAPEPEVDLIPFITALASILDAEEPYMPVTAAVQAVLGKPVKNPANALEGLKRMSPPILERVLNIMVSEAQATIEAVQKVLVANVFEALHNGALDEAGGVLDTVVQRAQYLINFNELYRQYRQPE